MITDFVNYCLHHNIFHELGHNFCDCADWTVYVNFWIDGKLHTLYAMDNGSYKLGNVVVTSIEDIERILGL